MLLVFPAVRQGLVVLLVPEVLLARVSVVLDFSFKMSVFSLHSCFYLFFKSFLLYILFHYCVCD